MQTTSAIAPVQSVASPVAAPAPAPLPTEGVTAQPPVEAPAAKPETGKKYVEIKSPMVGTFYRSSTPEKPPFVEIGQKIKKGDVVCIIEAMKLFNEIESDFGGTVVKAMLDNAQPVEYDQVLFLVEPD
jgi:acetyl-CoA carboxylase biotin carboxyl carrier protein